jgi:arabinogalactan oligomer / maltooligosaccharide transport system substrate-binding protein
MKRLIGLLSLILIFGSLTACARETTQGCDLDNLDGTTVCFDETTGRYAIEKDAVLVFGVDNDAWGNQIVALWDATYPELAGRVTFANNGSQGQTDALAQQTTEFAADVFMAIDGEVSRNLVHLLPFDSRLANTVKANALDIFFKAGNTTDVTVYAPMTYDGMAFIWNETMLKELGLDVSDANGDNLPDAFDTWEEIFALATSFQTNRPSYKGNPVNIVFPLSLGEVWSGYSSLTSGGWQLFATGDATKPGYDDPKFAQGLEFILAAKEARISVEADGSVTASEGMGWRWDDVINNESAPFGLVGTWMDIAGAARTTGATYRVSRMPTYNDNQLTPFVKTKGFVINGYTKYRSAAMELMRLVYSKEGFDAMVNGTSYAPSLVDGSSLTPTLTAGSFQEQMMSAFAYNYPEPAFTLPNNPLKKGMDSAYYPFMGATLANIYDGTKTIEQAVAELIELTNAAIAADNVRP